MVILSEYQERFQKSNVEPRSLWVIFKEVREVYKKNDGWVIGEPVIESKNTDGTINLFIPIEKKAIEQSFDTDQWIVQKNDVYPKNFPFIYNEIKENYTAELGWSVGEPVVLSTNADGTINFYVFCEKNAKVRNKERTH